MGVLLARLLLLGNGTSDARPCTLIDVQAAETAEDTARDAAEDDTEALGCWDNVDSPEAVPAAGAAGCEPDDGIPLSARRLRALGINHRQGQALHKTNGAGAIKL